MEVRLYKCSDDPRKCGKSLSTAETKTINARGETIVVENPSFLVDYDETLLLYNYCYIPKFKRYYFIEWQGEFAHRLRFSCNVDVLESFKTDLKKRTMYILRHSILVNRSLLLNRLLSPCEYSLYNLQPLRPLYPQS